MTTKHAGLEGLRWFIAIVDDVNDPNKLGRVGIRLLAEHDDPVSIQTKDLLWGMPVMPPNASSSKGLGQLHNIEAGSYVVGFFADGYEAQIPLIWGTWNGDGDLPPEVASGSTTAKKIPIGLEKPIRFGAKYPFNKVTKTKSGHLFEMDDTPGSERIHLYHKAGSYTEIDFMGNRIDGTILNYHNSVGGIRNDYTKLIHNTTALGAINQSTVGTYTVAAGAAASFNAGGTIGMTSGLATSMTAGGLASITGGAGVNIKSPIDITSAAPEITSAGGMVTMTGVKNKTQKYQLAEDIFNLIAYDDNTAIMLDPTGVSINGGVPLLKLTKAGASALLSGTITTIRGDDSLLLTSVATTITGATTTTINGGGTNVLNMNSAGASWNTTGTMTLTPTATLFMNPSGKFDVRSPLVSTWSATSTTMSTDGTMALNAITSATMSAPSVSILAPGGDVSIGGTALTAEIGASTITVGIGTTGSVTIHSTGVVVIDAPSGVTINGPLQVNGLINTTGGTISQNGVQVKT